MQVRLILSDSYFFFLRNFRQIASLCLPFLLVDAFLESLFARSQDFQSLHWVSFVALYPIYTAALILYMAKSAEKEHPQKLDIIVASLKLWWPYYILTVVNLALGVVGLFLFIVPGIWIMARLSFAEFFLVLNGLNPWEAISQSFKATKQYFWYIFSFIVLIYLGHGVSDFLIGQTIQSVNNNLILSISVNAAVSMIMLFFDVVLFRIFMEAVIEESAV